MTTSIAVEAARFRRPVRQAPATPYLAIADLCSRIVDAHVAQQSGTRWPSPEYAADPVRFALDVLGQEPWSKQVEILEAIRDHRRVAITSGHKTGKALAHDTPVLTPDGWRKHGDLKAGDQVFGSNGEPCNVVATMAWADRPMMRVEFEDGTHIDADERHEWLVHSRATRKRGKPAVLRETRQLAENLTVPNGDHQICNWSIDLPSPIATTPKDLPLDPYLLGVWLGDGNSADGGLTTPDNLGAAFEAGGFHVAKRAAVYAYGVHGLSVKLRAMGLLHNKHVPELYLHASKEQRLALLQGLLDTDGTCSEKGRIQFTSTREQLATSVLHLARTLGIKARIKEKRAKLNGRDCGPCWVVEWSSPERVFRLPRKAARLRTSWQKKSSAHRRMAIVSITPLEPQGVQCIEVDSADHLYLAGESLIPTHNSHSAAMIALWFYCSFGDARVVMSSTTARQVDQILWRELRKMFSRSKRPIDGEPRELARTGLKAPDFREIVGFTAKEAEAVAGISGANLLYILDEASGIPDAIFEAIEGNRAGGARVVMFSNPTRTEGEFFEAFHSKAAFYKTIRISSEETPNAIAGTQVVPGLAGRDWIEEKKLEWGPESALYKIRIKGEFVLNESGKILSVHQISQAEERWPETAAEGRLQIGIDPAGPGLGGDESGFAIRRGQKILMVYGRQSISEDAHLVEALGLLKEHRIAREPLPLVVVDREGPIGMGVYHKLRAYADANPEAFQVLGVRASDKAQRQPDLYDRVRDELWESLRMWIAAGGAIPEDTKLSKELHAPEWDSTGLSGRLKCTPKSELRKQLGRSPDRADACTLAVWEPAATIPTREAAPARSEWQGSDEFVPQDTDRLFDPYGGGS